MGGTLALWVAFWFNKVMQKYDPVAGKYYEDNSPLGIGNSPYNQAAYKNMNSTSSSSKPKKSSSSSSRSSYSSSSYSHSYSGYSGAYVDSGSFFLGFILGLFITPLNLILSIVFKRKDYHRSTANGFLVAFIFVMVFLASGGVWLILDYLPTFFPWAESFRQWVYEIFGQTASSISSSI